MRTSKSLAIGAALAAVLTHGAVLSGLNFSDPSPPSGYEQFFRQVLLRTEQMWSYAHGWPPLSHVRDFGQFYAPLVQFVGPLLGFAVWMALGRRKVGVRIWQPLVIVAALAPVYGYADSVSVGLLPWLEAGRAVLVVVLMAWTITRTPSERSREGPVRRLGLAWL